ncbi:hypothetical protein [Desulfovibrio aminophilus]|uniref:hypothetical protein n=1 Tax=Desulfovibrio aminophilus TaxID=81425 RepID=UPI003394B75F
MKMQDVRAMARRMEVKIGNMSKKDAVRAIQRAEGNFDCYGRAEGGFCDQAECLFYDDCMKQSAAEEN